MQMQILINSTFSSLLEDPSTHDVTFKTSDGGSVSAHRVIVAAGSPVFMLCCMVTCSKMLKLVVSC